MNRFKEILYHPEMHDAKEALFTIRDKANAYKKLYPDFKFGEAALLEITNAVNYYQTQRKAHQDKVQAKKLEDERKKAAKKESSVKKDAPKRAPRKKVRLSFAFIFYSYTVDSFLGTFRRSIPPLSLSTRTKIRVRLTTLPFLSRLTR